MINCPYCQRLTEKVTGKEIYPHRNDLWSKVFFRCLPCEAWVGCHPGTDAPLGRLANAELRRCKSQVHSAFDPLWKSRERTRTQAYQWLADQLGIDVENCHIGEFDVATCKRAVGILANGSPS